MSDCAYCASWLWDKLTSNPCQSVFVASLISLCVFPPVAPLLCCLACGLCCIGKRQSRSFVRTLFGSSRKGPPLMLDEENPPEKPILDLAGTACPYYWENQDCLADFDERYDEPKRVVRQVQELFDQTWRDVQTRDRNGPAPKRLEVLSVQRVEDRMLWAAYQNQKRRILDSRPGGCTPVTKLRDSRGGPCSGPVKTTMPRDGRFSGLALDGAANEFYVFHGCSPEGALGISEDGFRMELSGSKNGNMFGKGAYFAECSSKSDEYAKEGSGIYKGICAMLLCRVCCGELFQVFRRDDAAVNAALRSGAYDGVMGDREASVGTYREFVVYRERQIYPEYVVLYKRVFDSDDWPDESETSGSESSS
mmetsp:Transcript_13521/g.36488  ORF Transcript_13521/g.36488 Transcript_13521/m.36488 type:complete len:364 (-) Transcript_13521:110-1201(-)